MSGPTASVEDFFPDQTDESGKSTLEVWQQPYADTFVAATSVAIGSPPASTQLSVARAFHTANLLADGTVLFAGGIGSTGGGAASCADAGANSGAYLGSVEVYSPNPTATPLPSLGACFGLSQARGFHTATTLAPSVELASPSGNALAAVLFAGGYSGSSDLTGLRSAEAYFPSAGTASTQPPPNSPPSERSVHSFNLGAGTARPS